MTLPVIVGDFCRQYGKEHVWIAFSGGLDSRVLLDACRVARQQSALQFHVIHIHHGLSPNADAWARECARLCANDHFDFHLLHADLSTRGDQSLEDAARIARYQLMAEHIKPDDLLLTAHHQDDQAETLLLQLLRGSGPKGLAAMPAIKSFAAGWHGRPFLSLPRSALHDYACQHQLAWVDDESNRDRSLTRNFIRHDIMPVLRERWPTVEAMLSRSAQHCAESQALLEESAMQRLMGISGTVTGTLSVSKLLEQSGAWQRQLLRSWIGYHGYTLPDTAKLACIQQNILHARRDRMPCVAWDGAEVRRYRDNLYVRHPGQAVPQAGKGLALDKSAVMIRTRMLGESVEVLNRGKISLKNLFQEWQVPAWERDTLPLVFYGNKLIEVPGYFADPAYYSL